MIVLWGHEDGVRLRMHAAAGKVVDLERRTTGGFARGSLRLAGLGGGAWAGRKLCILFQVSSACFGYPLVGGSSKRLCGCGARGC